MSWLSKVLGGAEPARPVPEQSAPTPPRAREDRSPVQLNRVNLERFLREHPRAVVDVWAPWCGPCRAFAPIFTAAAREWGGTVGFGKIHADHEPSLVARFGARSIPSLLYFREGELVRIEAGVISPDRFSRQLRKVFRDLP
jgi:thioredoxin 2